MAPGKVKDSGIDEPTVDRWMSVDSALNLARKLHQEGQLSQAQTVAQQVADFRNGHPDAFHLLGIIAYEQGNLDKAIRHIEKAVAMAPRTASFFANLAELLRIKGRTQHALEAGTRAVQLDGKNPKNWNNLGIIHYELSQFADAERCYRQALVNDPNFAQAYNNLGNALVRLERPEDAHDMFRQAIALKSDYTEAMVNEGLCFREDRNFAAAENRLRQAIEVAPSNANAHVSRSVVAMLQGNYQQGLPEYEWRLALRGIVPQGLPGKPWQGESVAGKRLFVFCEQGLGDTLQFMRYLQPLVARGTASIAFFVPAHLRSFLASNLPEGVTIANKMPAADGADFHCALMSIPLLARLPIQPEKPAPAYLQAPADKVAAWRNRFESYKGLKVGVVWAGSLTHKFDYLRSMAPDYLLPLVSEPGCTFFSLQIGPKASSAKLLDRGVVDLAKQVDQMGETAAVISALDLMISVDTSLAHLSGALGTPVWTMLSWVPDWRWGLEGDTTPLYQSMRLFRQQAARDWPSAVSLAVTALRERVARNTNVQTS